jgi:hypothetical protein
MGPLDRWGVWLLRCVLLVQAAVLLAAGMVAHSAVAVLAGLVLVVVNVLWLAAHALDRS